MIKRGIIILFLFFSMHLALSQCNSNQINVNTASLDQLDQLSGIGPTKAQAIIDARPYSSIDDLDRAVGIGPSTVDKIKQQGLACVDSEETSVNTQQTNTQREEGVVVEENIQTSENSEVTIDPPIEETTESSAVLDNSGDNRLSESIINLNSDTQTKEVIVYASKNELIRKYSIYIFSFFLILVIIILLIKR